MVKYSFEFFWEMKHLRCKMYKEKWAIFWCCAAAVPFGRMLRSSYFVLLGWNMHVRRLCELVVFAFFLHQWDIMQLRPLISIQNLRCSAWACSCCRSPQSCSWTTHSVCFCFLGGFLLKRKYVQPLFQWSLFFAQVCPPTVWPADAPAPGGCGVPSMCFLLNPGYQPLASQDPCSRPRCVAGPVKIVARESQELARLTHHGFVGWKCEQNVDSSFS